MNPNDDLGLMIVMLPFFFVLFIIPLSFLCWIIGYFRNESFPKAWIKRSQRFLVLTIFSSILVYLIFLEVNPLKQYGVEFFWHTGGASGSWYSVQPIVKQGNIVIEGPDVGMTYPWLSFKDIDKDGIKDIIVTSQTGDRKVIIHFQPAQHGKQPSFTLLEDER